ncbi:MAG: hypothetical protein HRU20_03385 [Pseudomonadales bacterium]|nr:hypothetical protein [Pseudomonadales bacterium]
MNTPKNLKLKHQPSAVPQVLLWLIAGLVITALLALHLHLLILSFFIAGVLLQCFWQLHVFRVDAKLVLVFEGEQWRLAHESQSLALAAPPRLLFKSEYLLLLAFKTTDCRRWRKIYLSSDNCSQADYRAVCRLL